MSVPRMASRSRSGTITDNKRFYKLLGVAETANEKEIKRAYKRLALKLHPDKNPTADPSKFNELQYAHEVLTDPNKRQIYDKFGEKGLQTYEQYGSVLPPGMMVATTVGIVGCLFCFAFILVTVFGVLVDAKTEGANMTWLQVFAPIITIDVFLVLIVLCLLVAPTPPDAPNPIAFKVCTFLQCALFISFQVILILQLDKHPEGEELETYGWLGPLYGMEVVGLAWGIIGVAKDFKAMDEAEEDFVGHDKAFIVYNKFRSDLIWILWLAFFTVKVNGDVDWSWFVVFAPQIGLRLVYWAVDTVIARKAVDRSMFEFDIEYRSALSSVSVERLVRLFLLGLVVLFFCLLSAYLDDSSVFTMAEVFAPLFALVGFLMLVSCLMCVCGCLMGGQPSDLGGGEGQGFTYVAGEKGPWESESFGSEGGAILTHEPLPGAGADIDLENPKRPSGAFVTLHDGQDAAAAAAAAGAGVGEVEDLNEMD